MKNHEYFYVSYIPIPILYKEDLLFKEVSDKLRNKKPMSSM